CLLRKKLFYVIGLSYDANETILNDAFEQCGEVIESKVICDRVSGKSKGYGFVNHCGEGSK
ncbi:glycine-rich RNA-binding protein 2, mitochondrial-like, partial [Primulina eburnea]|uniref:glycine-rich RNA-binding protein 2, mitochondrial-like n=1 Tax=Primulina eburnea TaxID=1245227 RepID=UPI003C6C0421